MADTREYQRGYNRGKVSADAKLAEYRKAVIEANERARRAESGKFGPCQSCARWTRNQQCYWGYCHPPGFISIADENWWGEPGQKVCTQENFGCVRYSQREE